MGDDSSMLDISGLSVRFPSNDGTQSKRYVLDRLSLTVSKGEFVCIVGPSGCGKTTLLNSIAGFQPYEGQLLFRGKQVTRPDRERGVMFQEYALFPWYTVEENVALGPALSGMGRRERAKLARDYIRLVGLSGFERAYPNRLSGGMKQRVSLARMLINEPAIALLDEPFAALDEQNRETLQDELLRIREQSLLTCLFITHSLSEAVYLADRVVVLLPAPAGVALDVSIELPRSARDRDDIRFGRYVQQIRQAMRGAVS